jgi:hypothetical protein
MTVCVAAFGSMMATGVQAKMIAAWTFDEGSGTTTKDVVSGKTGTLKGGVSWDAGKIGSAVKFDGKSGQVDIPDTSKSLVPPKITLTAWVKLADVSGTKSIAEQYDWSAGFGAHAFRMNGAQVQLWVIWGAGGDNVSAGAVTPNVWTHVAGSYDGETVRVFVNGKTAGEKKLAKQDLIPSSKSLSIGVRGDTKDVHWMNGSIDEVAIYDEALSEAALATTMKGVGTGGTPVEPRGKAATTWATLKEGRR